MVDHESGRAGPEQYDPTGLPGDKAPALPIGAVLMDRFVVNRLIARGRLGDVFEGTDIASDQRVAIKVLHPWLAANASVQAMFQNLGPMLKRLSHRAIVQHVELAQDPALGLRYIVTEFVDGISLSKVLGQVNLSQEELREFASGLADGLRTAHALGAIHRNIAPDNILLKDGRLDRAKIIDFGVAKLFDPASKTILGNDFGYVSPEQLGEFGGRVGPSSDVYSLGLVLLAMATRRQVDMGATYQEALDRRLTGPDLAALPASLRPIVERMIHLNPAQRFQSMDDVIAAFDRPAEAAPPPAAAPPPPPPPAAPPPRPPAPPPPPPPPSPPAPPPPPPPPAAAIPPPPAWLNEIPGAARSDANRKDRRQGLLAGAGVAGLLLLGLGYWLASSGILMPPNSPSAQRNAEPTADRIRAVIATALPSIGCTWLDISKVEQNDDGFTVGMRGAALDPDAVRSELSRALVNAGLEPGIISVSDVVFATPQTCVVMDAFRPIRNPLANGLLMQRTKLELEKLELAKLAQEGTNDEYGAPAVVDMDIGPPTEEVAFLALEPSGEIELPDPALPLGRAAFVALAASPKFAPTFTKTGDTRYRVLIDTTHVGISGMILVNARQPFTPSDRELIMQPPESREADWPARIAEAAARGGWQAQMAWYYVVDETPG